MDETAKKKPCAFWPGTTNISTRSLLRHFTLKMETEQEHVLEDTSKPVCHSNGSSTETLIRLILPYGNRVTQADKLHLGVSGWLVLIHCH